MVAADPDEALDDELLAAAGAALVDVLPDELDEDEALDAGAAELPELPLVVEALELDVLLDDELVDEEPLPADDVGV